MNFSEKLILLRKRKGMTQTALSNAVGVSRQSVYKWESGQSYPEAGKLLEIRRLFGVSIDILLDDDLALPSPEEAATARRGAAVLTEESSVPAEKSTTPNAEMTAARIEQTAAAPAEVTRKQDTAPSRPAPSAPETPARRTETSGAEGKSPAVAPLDTGRRGAETPLRVKIARTEEEKKRKQKPSMLREIVGSLWKKKR